MKLVKMMSVSAVAILFLTLAACNTVKGVGQDMQAGGKALSGSAEKHGAND